MQVGKVDRRPHLTEYPVADPAEQSQRPPESRHQTQLEHTGVFTPEISLLKRDTERKTQTEKIRERERERKSERQREK